MNFYLSFSYPFVSQEYNKIFKYNDLLKIFLKKINLFIIHQYIVIQLELSSYPLRLVNISNKYKK
jgi:hypothetical protein